VKAPNAPISIFPSKTLLRFADQITALDGGPIVDAPCGYGRNAVALAARGRAVIAIDKDRERLSALNQVKETYVRMQTNSGVGFGKIVTVCADLSAGWPLAPGSISTLICVHFTMAQLIPTFLSALKERGYLYIETFGGHGQNYRDLPKTNEFKELLSRQMELKYYKERKVGPVEIDSVAVTLLAQRRR
jgi:SAM-dependent methyltransferase